MIASLGLLSFVVILCLAPLYGILSHIELESIRQAFVDPSFWNAFSTTLITGTFSALLSTLIGLGFSLGFTSFSWRVQRVQRLGLLIPYLVPNFVFAMAYVLTWNPASGIMHESLPFPGGLYGIKGMTLLFSITHMPVAFLLLEEKLKRIDTSLIEAARLSGASFFQVLRRIQLPLLLPTIFSALTLCFALNISAFAIPAWIGAPARQSTLTFRIYEILQLGGPEGILESAPVALVLFLGSIIPILLGSLFRGHEKKYVMLSGKSARQNKESQNPYQFAGFQFAYFSYNILVWVLPLGVLVASTLVPPGCLQTQGMTCFSSLNVGKYQYVLFELSETRMGLWGSLYYGGLSSLILMVLALIFLIATFKKPKISTAIEFVINVPLATPGAIIALGLIIVYSGKYYINLYNTALLVMLAYIIKHMSLAYQPLKTGLMNISSSLHEAAQISGAPPTTVWTKIILPILRPEWVGGFFLVFIPILGELTMSIFLSNPNFKSIGTVLFDLQDYADGPSASALAVLLVLFVLALNQLTRTLSRGKLGY